LIIAYLKELHTNFGYPEDLIWFDFHKNLSIVMDPVIWDIEQGLLLKLGIDKKVTHAIRGFTPLTETEIK
jgi:hypothetical protein